MRILTIIVSNLIFCICAQGQLADLKVVATAGNSFEGQDFNVDWTLGEPVILTFENAQGVITQGFHQPDYQEITTSHEVNFSGEIQIAPNPAIDETSIILAFPEFQAGFLFLYDMSGHKIRSTAFAGERISISYPINDLAPGKYIIQVRLLDKNESRSIQFAKI